MASSDVYQYDFPVPSTSTLLQPPSPTKTTRRRSASPIHCHLPLPHSTSSRYSPSSRASDISRLLDPSYAPRRSSVALSAAYVDHHGDLHDPDYRDFPAVATPTRRVNDPDAEDAASSDDDTSASISSAHPGVFRRASSTRRAEREAFARALSPPYRPSYSFDTPPASLGSGEDSPFSTEDDITPFADEKELKRRSKRASRRSALLRVEAPVEEETQAYLVEEEQREQPQYRVSSFADPAVSKEVAGKEESYVPSRQAEALEWTPTCGQSMRRRWQAVALRFRFGVFRAKRKVRRRVRGN